MCVCVSCNNITLRTERVINNIYLYFVCKLTRHFQRDRNRVYFSPSRRLCTTCTNRYFDSTVTVYTATSTTRSCRGIPSCDVTRRRSNEIRMQRRAIRTPTAVHGSFWEYFRQVVGFFRFLYTKTCYCCCFIVSAAVARRRGRTVVVECK